MSMAYPGITHCSECGKRLDGRLGRCESCVSKYKLIDILNKIANGELKEGIKVVYCGTEYELRKANNGATFDLFSKDGKVFFSDNYIGAIRNEVELIEPDHFPDVGKMAEHIREDTKMIETTDNNTEKIEELDENKYILKGMADVVVDMFDKLNEVIHKINKED